MNNFDLKLLCQQIKDDFELSDNQIFNTIDAVLATGIKDEKAFCEIVYDACSRIATCEINTDRKMRFNYHFPYNDVVKQSIDYYYKEHTKKK